MNECMQESANVQNMVSSVTVRALKGAHTSKIGRLHTTPWHAAEIQEMAGKVTSLGSSQNAWLWFSVQLALFLSAKGKGQPVATQPLKCPSHNCSLVPLITL